MGDPASTGNAVITKARIRFPVKLSRHKTKNDPFLPVKNYGSTLVIIGAIFFSVHALKKINIYTQRILTEDEALTGLFQILERLT